MQYTTIPFIVVACYLGAELYKMIFRKKEELYRFIPLFVALLGGILGLLVFYTYPTLLLEATNPYNAFIIGVVSGASSTGANQLIKQWFKHSDETQ